MKRSKTFPIEVLLIEDIPKNIDIIKQTLNNTKFEYTLHIANSLTERLNYLRKNGNTNKHAKPDMIFFNAYLISNFEKEIIQKTQSNKDFSHTPILFLNIKDDKIEIAKAIDKHINYQSTKMCDIEYFIETIVSLKEFVGSLVKLSKLAALLETPVKVNNPSRFKLNTPSLAQ